MARNSGTNIANGILSAIVIGCGIVLSVLIAVLFRKVSATLGIDTSGSVIYSAFTSGSIWTLGFGFMLPGLIGVIASLVQQKGGYITQMIFCILSLVIMGIFCVLAFFALSSWSMYNYRDCISISNSCSCFNGFISPMINLGSSCEDLNAITSFSLGCSAMIVLGWVFTLVTCVTGGMLACSNKVHPGVTIQQNAQPAGTVMYVNNPVGPLMQGGYGGQPGYGAPPEYGVQPGYGPQTGYGAPPVYGPQTGYGTQPGYVARPDFGPGPAGAPVSPVHPVDAKAHM